MTCKAAIATMCYLPGQHTPERECWYINMGAVDKDFCTVRSMVKAQSAAADKR